ncbi:DinB superfamily protein [Bhargavaea cecembensis DSE10]|uniref:DinB superfamily protein n=1 Tax=Bhargavaea cecembensis DSE10 TaxID=1235279 RepID=M7NG52_9BACL|nr:DinB family protein [Bhargavaea cecembensis]EMR06166.1 DinB superfamily protein [Bhargavaea cecembensis DSE10]
MTSIKQMKFARGYTLGQLSQLEGADWDKLYPGFRNNIRWNAGHIFVSLENFTKMIAPDYEVVHPEWSGFFNTGTSPDGWGEGVPSDEELLSALKEQTDRIAAALEGQLDGQLGRPLEIAGHQMDTGEKLLQFTVWHEGVHGGILNAMAHLAKG